MKYYLCLDPDIGFKQGYVYKVQGTLWMKMNGEVVIDSHYMLNDPSPWKEMKNLGYAKHTSGKSYYYFHNEIPSNGRIWVIDMGTGELKSFPLSELTLTIENIIHTLHEDIPIAVAPKKKRARRRR